MVMFLPFLCVLFPFALFKKTLFSVVCSREKDYARVPSRSRSLLASKTKKGINLAKDFGHRQALNEEN